MRCEITKQISASPRNLVSGEVALTRDGKSCAYVGSVEDLWLATKDNARVVHVVRDAIPVIAQRIGIDSSSPGFGIG